MKRALFASIVIALSGLLFPGTAQASTVVRVVDGDTVRVVFHGAPRTLRLYCIDAPEKAQPYGAAATAALREALGTSAVSVRVLRQDRYGRSVARVRVNRRDVSLELVRQGLAWEYKTLCKDPRFGDAEDAARAAKRGLWADAGPINPSDWRKGVR